MSVTLSYRGSGFYRAKEKNRIKAEQAANEGRLLVLLSSKVTEIFDDTLSILVNVDGEDEKNIVIKNDIVIVCAGGIAPTPFLKKTGIHVEEKFGEA